jgi:Nucleotidyl transferase AbiEii toxin, Type IV TA system
LDLSVPTPNPVISSIENPLSVIRERLQIALACDLGDLFIFLLSNSEVALPGPTYGGIRFTVDARLNNVTFAKFHLDVAIGDVPIPRPDWIAGQEFLSFVDIPAAKIAVLPVERHFAEKIHASTLPRSGELNSRIKDLIDIVLLMDLGLPEAALVVEAIRSTFVRRNTHKIPISLPSPPDEWVERYEAIASECGVSRETLHEAIEYASAYWASLSFEELGAPYSRELYLCTFPTERLKA